MNQFYLGLGANLGNRKENLEKAIGELAKLGNILAVSSVHETPALIPPRSPNEWNLPYLNLVIELETEFAPFDLLLKTRAIETALGRVRTEKWSPRTLDIDLLCGSPQKGISESAPESFVFSTPELTLPHPEIFAREFVLGPLAEISPKLILDGKSVRKFARGHTRFQPRLMGIVNLTPDSFSDGGKLKDTIEIEKVLDSWDAIPISLVDIGGESTRPGAQLIDEKTEWARIGKTIAWMGARYQGKFIRPKISIDTRHAQVAELALSAGVDIINDVSGLSDPRMLEVLSARTCDVVLMHSLSVPPTRDDVLDEECDPVEVVKNFFESKLKHLEMFGIARARVILDPGIGFGKTPLQSLVLLRRIAELNSLGCRILCGHSRKSFLTGGDRDAETLGISFELAQKGVDFLRVHDPLTHHRAFLAGRQIS